METTTRRLQVGDKVSIATGDTGRIVPLTDWPGRRPDSWTDDTMVIVRWDEYMPPTAPAPRDGGLRYSPYKRAEAAEILTVVFSAPRPDESKPCGRMWCKQLDECECYPVPRTITAVPSGRDRHSNPLRRRTYLIDRHPEPFGKGRARIFAKSTAIANPDGKPYFHPEVVVTDSIEFEPDDEPTAGGPCEHVDAHHGIAGSGLDGCDECGVTWRRPADRCLATVMVFDGVDSGEPGPCDRPATGTRRDVTDGTPFPACDEHAEIVEPFDPNTGGRPSPFAPPPGAPPALGGRIPDTTPAPVEPAGTQLDRDDAAARVLNAALEWLSAPDGDDVRETMLLADATRDYRQVVAR